MGMCLEDFGRISIEVRRESFYVHAGYAYTADGEREPGEFASAWRELPHPEFLIEDIDDLIKALEDARDYLKRRKK